MGLCCVIESFMVLIFFIWGVLLAFIEFYANKTTVLTCSRHLLEKRGTKASFCSGKVSPKKLKS